MRKPKIDATLSLRSGDRFLVGRDRIKLLEAVAKHGSISKAAKAVGYSYKTAWDSVDAINNLLPSPAFVTKMGGSGGGGGAQVTDEGLRLIETFNKIEEKLARLSSRISEAGLHGEEEMLLFTFGARISSRNTFHCIIEKIKKGPVDVELELRLSSGAALFAVVTNAAVDELELVNGKNILALVKAYSIGLSVQRLPDPVNNISGTVSRLIKGQKNWEVLLGIGEGKTLTTVIPREQAEKLSITRGQILSAHFSPQDVIIAAN
jgi:molybdate transport system regulatory protein